MNNELTIKLINNYLDDINYFMSLFKKKYGRNDVIKAWREGDIPQFGNVTNEIEYELHGIGCCIFFPNKEVDFDFSKKNRTDGFDLWRLKKYLKQCPEIKKNMNEAELEYHFNELKKNNYIKKIHEDSSLYFLNKENFI